MMFKNKKYKQEIIALRVIAIFISILFLMATPLGILFILVGEIIIGLSIVIISIISIGASIYLFEFYGVRDSFVSSVEILDEKIILFYKNKKKIIEIPFSCIKNRKVTDNGAIQYFSSMNFQVSPNFPFGMISSTLFDEDIFTQFEKMYKKFKTEKKK